MREPRSASIENSRSTTPDALIALVRLLARQAARDFVSREPTPAETTFNPQDHK